MVFSLFYFSVGRGCLLLLSLWALSGTCLGIPHHAVAFLGTPKYPPGFKHFDYVNPQAPCGGTLKTAVLGTFDSLNAYYFKGTPAAGTGVLGPNYLFDTLMVPSGDEPETLYGLIAHSVEVASDRSWILFNLNPQARFADGHAVTAADVVFTLETLKEKGQGFMQVHYKKVQKAEILGPHCVKMYLSPQQNEKGAPVYTRDLPLIVARMVVLPRHRMEGKFENLSLEDMVGSGPYKIQKVDWGRSITYKRRPDYWAKDLNVQKGLYNFDTVRFDYYRTKAVMVESFKAGHVDFILETDPKAWETLYNFPAIRQGRVKKLEIPHHRPVGLHGFVMNTRKVLFQDRRIRQALSLIFNAFWVNQNLYAGAFQRTQSYFENTDFSARGLPSPEERGLLEPLRAFVAPEVFTHAYVLPFFKTYGEERQAMRHARTLLKQAGCREDKGHLIHPTTGKPFVFKIMVMREEQEKLALALQRNLKRSLGIHMHVCPVDEAHYWRHANTLDFDMIIFHWSSSASPSGDVLLNRFGTKSCDRPGSLNYMGAKNPAIDLLCHHVSKATTLKTLQTALKALDRVLLHEHFVIPLFYGNKNYVAMWDKFGFPDFDPQVGLMTLNWWTKASETPDV